MSVNPKWTLSSFPPERRLELIVATAVIAESITQNEH
jgi:hypothetical protein